MKNLIIRSLTVLPALALLAAVPSARASEASAEISSSAAELRGDAAKAALKTLDAQIDALDEAVDNAPTEAEKDSAKRRLDALKERRNDLRKTYGQARFDELKGDIRAETARIGAWAKRDYKREPVAVHGDNVARDAHTAVGNAAAALDLNAYKHRATDTDKNEARNALAALDHRIDELDERADNMPKGADRDIAKRRIKALEDRKDELKSDFNKDRFNALVDDVQDQWKQLR